MLLQPVDRYLNQVDSCRAGKVHRIAGLCDFILQTPCDGPLRGHCALPSGLPRKPARKTDVTTTRRDGCPGSVYCSALEEGGIEAPGDGFARSNPDQTLRCRPGTIRLSSLSRSDDAGAIRRRT